MSEDPRIAALEGALRDATRMRFEAETKLLVAEVSADEVRRAREGSKWTARTLLELWWAAGGIGKKMPTNHLHGETLEALHVAEMELRAETDPIPQKPESAEWVDRRVAAWKAALK